MTMSARTWPAGWAAFASAKPAGPTQRTSAAASGAGPPPRGGGGGREPVAAIYCSPRERTQETAKPIAAACNVGEIAIRAELDEIDFGVWSGKTFEELNADARWRAWNDRRQEAS